MNSEPSTGETSQPESSLAPKRSLSIAILRVFAGLIGTVVGLFLAGVLVLGFILSMAYPNLPALDSLMDYRPKIPLRVFSADNVLIGEFGEERRSMVRVKDISEIMKKA